MSHMKQLYELTKSLREFAHAAESVAEGIEGAVTLLEEGSPVEVTSTAPTAPTLNFDQVRDILSEKGMAGHNEQVRALLIKYGAKRLSELDPKHFPALLADAEAI